MYVQVWSHCLTLNDGILCVVTTFPLLQPVPTTQQSLQYGMVCRCLGQSDINMIGFPFHAVHKPCNDILFQRPCASRRAAQQVLIGR